VLVLGGLGAWWAVSRDNDHHSRGSRGSAQSNTVVPRVVGLRKGAAVSRLHQEGLLVEIVGGASKLPEGVVFAQTPGSGTRVARRATVVVDVSTRVRVKVPNVTGLTSRRAVRRLEARGFGTVVTQVRSLAPTGSVVRQRPVSGTRAPKGSRVALAVSRGAASVPGVVGDTQSTAQTRLRAAGLVSDIFQVRSSEPKGRVTAQRPAPGTRVAKGTHVRLNVSNGAAATTTSQTTTAAPTTTTPTTTTAPAGKVAVPSLVGTNQTDAQRKLLAKGLRARVVYVSSGQPVNRVVQQQPAAGAQVSRGTRVRISVSNGPSPGPTRTVPNVVGEDEATAKSDLSQAGFNAVVLRETTRDPTQVGQVIDEQPAAGTKAPAGSQVTIYVGKSA
jgi:serine/threonine-protein kinase